jgi:hypothetical protein
MTIKNDQRNIDPNLGIADLLDRLAACWSALYMESLIDLWDADEPDPVYVAEELGDILIGLEDITFHLLRTASRLASARVTVREHWTKQLAPELALVVFISRWQFVRAETGSEAEAHSRVTGVCRRAPHGWRFIHYMEDSYHIPGERLEPGWGPFPPIPSERPSDAPRLRGAREET